MELQTEIPQQTLLIKDIRAVEYFDNRRYKFSFHGGTVRWIASVTTKLQEYRERGVEHYRETVGPEEANRALEEGGEMGSLVHHACFIYATGGVILYEPPSYQTVGIMNEEVAALIRQNALIRQQCTVQNIPHLTIRDQFRFLQVKKFKRWMDVVQPEVLFAETVVYSLKYDIAGRIDFLFRIKKAGYYDIAGKEEVFLPAGIVLPDVKSGAWSDKFWLQLGSYRKAVEESLGEDVLATVGIHLKAKTKSGLNTLVHMKDEMEHDFELYQHVAAIYDAKHEGDVLEEFEFESVLFNPLLAQKIGSVPLGSILPNVEAEKTVAQESLKDLGIAAESNGKIGRKESPETATEVNPDDIREVTKDVTLKVAPELIKRRKQ